VTARFSTRVRVAVLAAMNLSLTVVVLLAAAADFHG
jgi:hypothetical protein